MKKLVNLRLALFLGLSACMGVFFAYNIFNKTLVIAFISLAVFLGLLIGYICFSYKTENRKKSIVLSIVFLCVAIVCGSHLSIKVVAYENANLNNHIYTVTGRVIDVKGGDYEKVIIDNVILTSQKEENTKYKISLSFSEDSGLDIGDVITFTDTILDKDIFYNGRFSVYDIDSGVKYSASLSKTDVQIIGNEKTVFEKVNIFIRDTASKGLSDGEFSVVYALLTGNSDYMEGELLTNFRASGVAHIFAVSGLHIGFLAAVLNFILDKLKSNRIFKAIFIVLCLIFYSGICGFSASSIRATIMCAVLQFASVSGERYDGVNSIGVALLIVLLISPLQMFFAGFQLSFAVVLSILILSDPVSKIFKFLPVKIAQAIGAVLSAQLVSLPIMLAHFSAFSVCSVIVNLIFIPFVSFIYIFSLLSVVISGILSLPIILVPLNFLMSGIIWLMNCIDFTAFMVGELTLGATVIFYYLAMLFASGMLNIKKKAKIIISVSLAVCFLLSFSITNIVSYNQVKINSASNGVTSVSLVDYCGEKTLVINAAYPQNFMQTVKKITVNKGVEKVKNVVVTRLDNQVDYQALITGIVHDLGMEKFYYYGEMDRDFYLAMQLSFPKITCYNLLEEKVSIGNVGAQYILNGYGLDLTTKAGSIKFIGYGEDMPKDYTITQAKFAICQTNASSIMSKINCPNEYSYTPALGYESAQIKGIIKYCLNS